MTKIRGKEYKIKMTYKHGDKSMNRVLRCLDLGIEGVVVPEEITFSTTTKPTKKMFDGYKNALIQAFKKSDAEVSDIEVCELK